ncbi:cysteine synthase A [Phosphitispora fastidiosa]|uniref:cysteine synthase A n=1 Tax=Phosphitispora fastidiosa TaxID=2837202 RepID=UPI001E603E48|nr:cysteine synthase A [Phosphitispora fastidiosa]MBU7005724.1 cysteine synthase A [Phosphitispora fastidiosa]
MVGKDSKNDAADVTCLIGNTPLYRFRKTIPDGAAAVMAKMEMYNPGGSIKDRIALQMVEEAEKNGSIRSGSVIVEATSGNTGIGLAIVAASRGYRLILVMPESIGKEYRTVLRMYGAEVVATPEDEGMTGAVNKAEEILSQNPHYYMPRQFQNPSNPEVHRRTTGREILSQMEGKIDAFVAGIGTGGTITGVGEVLKQEIPGVRVIGVEPAECAVLSGGKPGSHRIHGIGAGFVPETLNLAVLDEVITVTEYDAVMTSMALARAEGVLAGYSSGAAVYAAARVARELGPGKRVVTILPDSGEKYLSMAPYFRFDLAKNGMN